MNVEALRLVSVSEGKVIPHQQNNWQGESKQPVSWCLCRTQDSEADRRYGKPKTPRMQPTEQRDDSDVDDIFAGLSDADEADEDEEVEEAAEAEDLEQVFKAVSDVLGTSQKRKPKKQELLDEAVPESEFNVSLGESSTGQSIMLEQSKWKDVGTNVLPLIRGREPALIDRSREGSWP